MPKTAVVAKEESPPRLDGKEQVHFDKTPNTITFMFPVSCVSYLLCVPLFCVSFIVLCSRLLVCPFFVFSCVPLFVLSVFPFFVFPVLCASSCSCSLSCFLYFVFMGRVNVFYLGCFALRGGLASTDRAARPLRHHDPQADFGCCVLVRGVGAGPTAQ